MGWISLVAISFLLNFYLMKLNTLRLAENKAKSFFSEIVTTRLWNSIHGGVYVLVTEDTQPNPYLNISDRDLETIDGKKLTKINPAYMTRQIAELADKYNDIKYHITSLNPIRPANKADGWESQTLQKFEEYPEGIFDKVNYDNITYYRYMAPLITEESCLICHAEQGYKVGEVRGGISVSFNSDVYHEAEVKQIRALSLIHIVVLFLGILSIKYYNRMSSRYLLELRIKNQKLEQEKLKQVKLNSELTISNKTKDKLFSIIGHDLKSPVNSIIGFTNLLHEKIKKNDFEKASFFIDHILNGGMQTNQLIENLSYWANAQKNAINFNPVNISLKEIFTEHVNTFHPIVSLKEITFKNELKQTLQISADLNMLGIILRNLISNAIKFTSKGGTIILNAVATESDIEISVKDDGVGISDEIKGKLFDESKNISQIGTASEVGTGLGLILCKEFVERHSGKIWANSELNMGTEFIFTLPKK